MILGTYTLILALLSIILWPKSVQELSTIQNPSHEFK